LWNNGHNNKEVHVEIIKQILTEHGITGEEADRMIADNTNEILSRSSYGENAWDICKECFNIKEKDK
jgi:hypothetical protein